MKTQVIIPAGGSGKRFKSDIAKPLVALEQRPIIVYALGIFERSPFIDSVIVVAPKKSLKDFGKIKKLYHFNKIKAIVTGGKTRKLSVANGLKALDRDTKIVVVHDAARPFVTQDMIKHCITAVKKSGAAVVAVPVKSTVKVVDPQTLGVKKTLDRSTLWEVQTPQAFKKDILIKAHKAYKGEDPSDDALMVEETGQKVTVVKGDYCNIKITTPEDLVIAKAILKVR